MTVGFWVSGLMVRSLTEGCPDERTLSSNEGDRRALADAAPWQPGTLDAPVPRAHDDVEKQRLDLHQIGEQLIAVFTVRRAQRGVPNQHGRHRVEAAKILVEIRRRRRGQGGGFGVDLRPAFVSRPVRRPGSADHDRQQQQAANTSTCRRMD